MSNPSKDEISNLSKYFAIESNNEFWRLSEIDLSKEEKGKILISSFASLYHWNEVGNDDNKNLAYLAVARALTINNIPDLAIEYATKTYEFFKNTEQKWIAAFTNAILSNALLINGDYDNAISYYNEANKIGSDLEPSDREIFEATFRLIPEPSQ